MIVQQVPGHSACTPVVQSHSPGGNGLRVPVAKCMSPEDATCPTSIAIRAIPTPSRSLAGNSMKGATKLGFSPSVHSGQAPSALTSVRCTPRSRQPPTPRSPCSSWAPPPRVAGAGETTGVNHPAFGGHTHEVLESTSCGSGCAAGTWQRRRQISNPIAVLGPTIHSQA